MRFYLFGPRIMGLRPGVSFTPADLAKASGSRAPGAAPTGSSFVYVLRGEHGKSKIGVSNDPLRRLTELQTGSPYRLEIAFLAAVEGTGYDIETRAHEMLGGDAMATREWFDVSPELAIAAVSGAASKLGRRLTVVDPAKPRPLAIGSTDGPPKSGNRVGWLWYVCFAAFGILFGWGLGALFGAPDDFGFFVGGVFGALICAKIFSYAVEPA